MARVQSGVHTISLINTMIHAGDEEILRMSCRQERWCCKISDKEEKENATKANATKICRTTATLQDHIGAVPEHIPFRTRVGPNFRRFLAPNHKRSDTTADRFSGAVATSNPFSAMLVCARNCEGGPSYHQCLISSATMPMRYPLVRIPISSS